MTQLRIGQLNTIKQSSSCNSSIKVTQFGDQFTKQDWTLHCIKLIYKMSQEGCLGDSVG